MPTRTVRSLCESWTRTRTIDSISGDLALTVTGNTTGPTATTGQLMAEKGGIQFPTSPSGHGFFVSSGSSWG